MQIVSSVAAMQRLAKKWRQAGIKIGFVPTMGYLHAGHLSLVREARKRVGKRGKVVVSIYVNPTQFAPTEDFAAYPRSFGADMEKFAAAGGDLIFAPSVEGIYGPLFATTVDVAGPAKAGLEDKFRPTHFAGVATVVANRRTKVQFSLSLLSSGGFQK